MNLKSVIAKLEMCCWWFRQVTGDAAYENYLRSAQRDFARARHLSQAQPCDAVAVMTREEFFLDSLRRRYSTTSRCC